MAETAAFDPATEGFLAEYDKVRGHVREQVTRQNLALWLPSRGALDVLDFGGGDGRDTIWLGNMRDRVTLLDESEPMIELATKAIKRARIPTLARIQVVHGSLEKLDEDQTFDVILSHGVLMYELENPAGQLQGLSDRLRTGGVLSLLTKGRAAASRQVKGPEAQERFEATGEYVNRRGLLARSYDPGELDEMLEQTGLEPIAHYGVRVFSDEDERRVEDVPAEDMSAIIEREVAASRDASLVEQGEMLHIIARKPAHPPTQVL